MIAIAEFLTTIPDVAASISKVTLPPLSAVNSSCCWTELDRQVEGNALADKH